MKWMFVVKKKSTSLWEVRFPNIAVRCPYYLSVWQGIKPSHAGFFDIPLYSRTSAAD
jgi:hypothetical protein